MSDDYLPKYRLMKGESKSKSISMSGDVWRIIRSNSLHVIDSDALRSNISNAVKYNASGLNIIETP